MSARKLSTFFLVLCFAASSVSADISLAKTLQRQAQYKNREIYFDRESQENSSLLYMFCQRSSQNMSCTIFKEEHYVDKLPRISPCNVTLKVEDPYVRIGETLRILPLNPSKALIVWVMIGAPLSGMYGFGEGNILKYTVVNFDTCRTIQNSIKTTTEPSHVDIRVAITLMDGEKMIRSTSFAFYDNVCDISFHDLLCGNDFCKLRIDRNTGQVISEAEFWYTQVPQAVDIVPKNSQNPSEGNFFIDLEGGVIYTNDEYRGLIRFPNDFHHQDWKKFRYSVRNRFITVCKEVEETKVKCDQINFNGTITMINFIDLQKKNLAPVPYTLRDGGFLFLTTECNSNCTENATNYVYKVDVDGTLSEIIEIENFNCNVNEFTHWHQFFENEQGNLCISLLCYDTKKKYPKGILVWESLTTLTLLDVYSNTPEKLHVQCLNASDL